MFTSLIDDRADMIICQRIENRFSLSAALYQFILFQNTAEAMEDEMKLGKDVTLLEDPADPALWACSKPKTGR